MILEGWMFASLIASVALLARLQDAWSRLTESGEESFASQVEALALRTFATQHAGRQPLGPPHAILLTIEPTPRG
jgi:hypothetical protein